MSMTLEINVLVKAKYEVDKDDKVWSNPALIEIPGKGIRFMSGTPQDISEAIRINSALSNAIT